MADDGRSNVFYSRPVVDYRLELREISSEEDDFAAEGKPWGLHRDFVDRTMPWCDRQVSFEHGNSPMGATLTPKHLWNVVLPVYC